MQPQNLSQTKCNSKLHCCIYFENLLKQTKCGLIVQNTLTFISVVCIIYWYGSIAQLVRVLA